MQSLISDIASAPDPRRLAPFRFWKILEFAPDMHLFGMSSCPYKHIEPKYFNHLFRKVQIISQPLPRVHFRDREARVTVCQRKEEVPTSEDNSHNDTDSCP